MKIVSVQHRGLRRLIEDDDPRELRPDLVRGTRDIPTALLAATNVDGVSGPLGRRIHQLSGERAAAGSISLSGNWRATFQVDGDRIKNLNLEDYH